MLWLRLIPKVRNKALLSYCNQVIIIHYLSNVPNMFCLKINFFFSFLEFAITFSFKDRITPLEFPRYHSLKPSTFLLWSGLSARQVCITAATQTLFPSQFGSTTSWLPCRPRSCFITLVCLRKFPMKGCVISLCSSDHVSSLLLLNFTPDWHFGWVKNYGLTILSS